MLRAGGGRSVTSHATISSVATVAVYHYSSPILTSMYVRASKDPLQGSTGRFVITEKAPTKPPPG